MRSRSGQCIEAPTWFSGHLPAQALDGDLWMARGCFDPLSAAVRRRQPREVEWRAICNMLFELPGGEGSFAQRARTLKQLAGQVAWEGLLALLAAGGEALSCMRPMCPT